MPYVLRGNLRALAERRQAKERAEHQAADHQHSDHSIEFAQYYNARYLVHLSFSVPQPASLRGRRVGFNRGRNSCYPFGGSADPVF